MRELFKFIDNYVNEIDIEEEKMDDDMDIKGRDIGVEMKKYMEDRNRVRIESEGEEEDVMRSLDENKRVIYINKY